MTQTESTFDGAWTLSIVTPIGTQTVSYTFVTGTTGLSGTATQGQDTTILLDPQLRGQRLTWTQQVTRPMKLKLHFDVTLDGDSLSGTAKASPLPASKVQGVRVSAP